MANVITGIRNSQILEAFLNGASKCELAVRHRLAHRSIDAILGFERHKLAVSPEAYYRRLRKYYGPEPTGSMQRAKPGASLGSDSENF